MNPFQKYNLFQSLLYLLYWGLQKIPGVKKWLWKPALESFHLFLWNTNPYLWASIGEGVVISRKAEIKNCRAITLEDGAWIEDHAVLSARGGKIRLGKRAHILPYGVVIAISGNVSFGEYCTVNPFCVLYGMAGGLKIGNAVRIAAQTVIVPGNHVFDDPEKQIRQQGVTSLGITIGDDVWLGAGVRILDGVTLGHGAVIAAGAVVTKDVPPLAVFGGVPARFLRARGQADSPQS